MERFLSRLRINWSAIGRAVVAQLPPSVKLIVSMDRTAWKTGTKVYNILTIGIAFDGLCITGAKTLRRHPIRVQSTTRRLRETIFKRGLILIEAILVGNSFSMVADGSNVKFDTDFST